MGSNFSSRTSKWSSEAASAILEETGKLPGPILISLQTLQEKFGYVLPEAIELVAKACNVSRADVHGVLSYYHDLRRTPPPKNEVKICVAEACQAVGSRELVFATEKALEIRLGEENSEIEISATYCFGNCALGPSSMVNGELIGLSSVEKIRSAVNGANPKARK